MFNVLKNDKPTLNTSVHKTSRRDGILVLKTNNPYKIAINGSMQEGYEIVCHDINYKTESLAYDLEQALMCALIDAGVKYGNREKSDLSSNDEENKKFFLADCPNDEQMESMCTSLCMPILMSREVKLTEIMSIFDRIALSGLIKCRGDISMTEPIWQTVHRKDKIKIAFSYMAFFVNPLSSLLNTSTKKIESKQGEAKDG